MSIVKKGVAFSPETLIPKEERNMQKGIVLFIVVLGSFFLLSSAETVSAGVEPSPWQPQINQLHSIELNIAAIDKRIGKLPDSLASPEGIAVNLQEMADKLAELEKRLADTLNRLPALSEIPFDGQDEVLSSLEGIRADSRSIIDVANRMGVEPSPWQPAASAVINNAQNILNTIDDYMCPIERYCPEK